MNHGALKYDLGIEGAKERERKNVLVNSSDHKCETFG